MTKEIKTPKFKFWKPEHVERNLVVIGLVLRGMTYEAAGNVVGLNKERVRRILMKFSNWAAFKAESGLTNYADLNTNRLKQSAIQKTVWQNRYAEQKGEHHD